LIGHISIKIYTKRIHRLALILKKSDCSNLTEFELIEFKKD